MSGWMPPTKRNWCLPKEKNDSSPTFIFCGGRLKGKDFGLVYGVLAADTKLGSLPEFEVQFEVQLEIVVVDQFQWGRPP